MALTSRRHDLTDGHRPATTASGVLRRTAAIGRSDARVVWLGIGALLVARIGLSMDMVSRPGLQYDETLFVNAATLRIPGGFLPYAFHGIPLMVFPYIGALKSWLYAPVFAIFGTSPETIRLPVVLIASAGLVLLYCAVRDLVNRPVAMLAFAALCFDNSVFWLTRDDVGPSAIELFLKCMALWCAARFARTQSRRWIWLALATLALGVFNKLNFIWTVNAATVVSTIVILRHRATLRSYRRMVAMWAGGLAVIYAAFGAYYFGAHIGNLVTGPGGGGSFGQPWLQFEVGMREILSGTWFYAYALAPLGARNGVVAIVLVLFAAGALASVAPWTERSFAVAALALATILIALQNLLTPDATAGWHYISIYPFVTIVAAYGAYAAAQTLLRRRTAVYLAVACVAVLALAYDGALLAKYSSDLSSREPTNPDWSPAVYQLSNDLHHASARIFTADWGIYNPLFALHPSRRYTELAFALDSPTVAYERALAKSIVSMPGPKLFVTHANAKLAFPDANKNLLATFGGHLRLIRTVDGRDGTPVFDVYQYR